MLISFAYQRKRRSLIVMSEAYIRSLLGVHPDWPKKGIVFLDIFPILRNPVAFEALITNFASHLFSSTIPKLESGKIDVVVGLDARGFLLGPILASRLGASFVPVRKAGKLPGKCIAATFEKEYGADSFELQEDAIPKGSNVIVVDDLIATGGSAKAAGELIAKCGGTLVENLFIIELAFLKGSALLGAPTYSIIVEQD